MEGVAVGEDGGDAAHIVTRGVIGARDKLVVLEMVLLATGVVAEMLMPAPVDGDAAAA